MIKIAVANLKGGVGKSTTTLFLAEHWSLRGLRVLVVDLDPQSNCSYMLLSRKGLVNWENARRTLPHLFEDKLAQLNQPAMAYIVPRGSDLLELSQPNSRGFVSVVPTVPRLWFEEYDFDRNRYLQNQDPVEARLRILQGFLDEIENLYDCVLFDCPPGFSTLTRSALRLSDTFVAPTLADNTSMRSLKDFVEIGLRDTLGIRADRLHVVVSKYTATIAQQDCLNLLRASYSSVAPPIPMRDHILAVTECLEGRHRTYKQKYGRPLIRPVGPYVQAMCDALYSVIF